MIGAKKIYLSLLSGTSSQPSGEFLAYKDTPFLTRRNAASLSTSREFSQLYPTCDWIGSTHHHVFLVSEGDGSRLGGIDRTIRYKRALADDPTVKENWVKDSPVDAWGDTPSFIDSGCLEYDEWVAGSYDIGNRVRVTTGSTMNVYESTANGNTNQPPGTNWTQLNIWDGNQCWMMSVIEHGGVQYGIYVGNRYIASRYGVGMIYSNDDFETFTRVSGNPIIPESGTLAAYYCHVHPTKVGSYWYMFIQNYVPAFLVEDHLYSCEIWRTTSDPTTSGWTGWTKLSSVDQLSGRGYGGAVDISQSWDDGQGGFRAYISPNESDQDGGYNAGLNGGTVYKTTIPVGNRILEIGWTDWTNFKDGHTVIGEVFRSPQKTEIETRTWCQKRTFNGKEFFIGMSFLWRCQTLLAGIGQNEPMNHGLVISKDENLTGGIKIANEVYQDWIKVFFPHQSRLVDTLGSTDVRPLNLMLNTSGTIVGSPVVARLNCIQPVSGGYVTDSNSNWIYSGSKVSVCVMMGTGGGVSVYGVAAMEGGWEIWKHSSNTARVRVYGEDGILYKEIAFNISSNRINNASDSLVRVGFIFENGTLRCTCDYNLNCTPTQVIRNDTFTTMKVSTNPLKVGETTARGYSIDVVGPVFMLSGDNVTDSNYLNHNLIAY